MRLPNHQPTGPTPGGAASPKRRCRARWRRVLRSSLLALGLLAGLAIGGCDRAQSPGGDDRDPVCGPVPGTGLPDDLRLARVDGEDPLFVATRSRRHGIGGRTRNAVTGLHALPLMARVLDPAPAGDRHVERVALGLRLEVETEVFLAPRARRVGDGAWTWVGPLVEVAREEDGERLAFDWTALGQGEGATEIGATAYVTSSRSRHAWETAPLPMPEDAVLVADFGVLPAARTVGPIAFRVLACEGDACGCVFAEVIDAADPRLDAWQSLRLSLAEFAGRDVVLRFETEALHEGALDAGLFADPELYRRAPAGSTRRPNLLLISLDTLGADHLGLHGYARETSPFIDDALAPRGTVFLRAIAPATTTGPSHMTLFTSLPPSVHGAVSNLGGRPLPDPVPTLAATLRAAGYLTGAVTENGAITKLLGFSRGFDHYEENASVERIRPEGHIESTFDAGRDFIARHRDLPWFLFLHTYQVHYPYTPPDPYADLFAEDDLDPPQVVELFSGGRSVYHPVRYDREIRFTDDRLRALWTQLEADGLLDDTLVVILADHGEAFLEHLYLGHGAELHRETVHVPLILVGPGVPAGLRIDRNVGLADVMPTVLDLLDVPAPPGLLGRSLVPLFDDGAEDAALATRPIFSEAWQTAGDTRVGKVKLEQPTLAVTRGDFKLIRYRDPAARDGSNRRHALYDLAADPFEQSDLLADSLALSGPAAEQLAQLSGLLDAYESENARRAAELGVVPDALPTGEIDPERIEKLRALGYIE